MEILGEVQNVRKDSKGIQVNNDWYMFFKPNKEIKKGDTVKLEYKENQGFKNIKKILIQEVKPEVKPEIKPINKLDTTTINTILMTAKDIKIAHLQHKVNLKFEDIVIEVLKGLERIKL